jgi:hypothetical protein
VASTIYQVEQEGLAVVVVVQERALLEQQDLEEQELQDKETLVVLGSIQLISGPVAVAARTR